MIQGPHRLLRQRPLGHIDVGVADRIVVQVRSDAPTGTLNGLARGETLTHILWILVRANHAIVIDVARRVQSTKVMARHGVVPIVPLACVLIVLAIQHVHEIE